MQQIPAIIPMSAALLPGVFWVGEMLAGFGVGEGFGVGDVAAEFGVEEMVAGFEVRGTVTKKIYVYIIRKIHNTYKSGNLSGTNL